MRIHRWADIPVEQLNPAFSRQVIHTEKLTVAFVRLTAGSRVPVHQHENEQVCVVVSGKLVFFAEDRKYELYAGDTLVVPPNVPHSVEAIEDSIAYDLFGPPREDWKRGEDSYLRNPDGKS